MRILVVEDEASLAKQLTSSIAEAGYAVDHAADGERADLLAQTEQYDAMVLDLGLPKIDGLTLLRKMTITESLWLITNISKGVEYL
jgi:two-component system, OmpR family, response regulator